MFSMDARTQIDVDFVMWQNRLAAVFRHFALRIALDLPRSGARMVSGGRHGL